MSCKRVLDLLVKDLETVGMGKQRVVNLVSNTEGMRPRRAEASERNQDSEASASAS